MKRGWLLLALLLLACGDPKRDNPPDGSQRIRVSLGASDPELTHVYSFAVRVSRLSLTMADGTLLTGEPKNIDVLRGGVLLETYYDDATPESLELRFDQPPNGSGVVPGDRAAAFLSCSIGGEPFDFHAEELPRARIDGIDGDDVKLRFTLAGLLDGFTVDDFDDPAPHRVDKDHNRDLADELTQRLGERLGLCDTCQD